MNKLFYSLLFVLPLSAMESTLTKIDKSCVFSTHDIGDVELYHNHSGFSVRQNGSMLKIPAHNVDANLRKATPEQIHAFTAAGYLALKKYDNGEYKIDGKVRGLGGGPLCAWWAYGLTKATCYSAVVTAGTAAVAGVVVASGGAAAAPMAVAALTEAAALGTGAMATGAAIGGAAIGAGVVTAAGATNVALATGAAASGGSIVLAIECASLTIGALFAGPWCP